MIVAYDVQLGSCESAAVFRVDDSGTPTRHQFEGERTVTLAEKP